MIAVPVLLVLWVLAGLYGRKIAVEREALEQPGALSAALQGGLWLRRALIWTTVSVPPALLDTAPDAAAFPGADARPLSELTGAAPAVSAPIPAAVDPIPVIEPVEAVAPIIEPVVEPVAAPEPVPVIQPIAEPVIEPVIEPIIEEETYAVPTNVERPKRLPGKPAIGTVKTLCPTCESKQSYGKDALCKNCGQLNPWLAEKWKLKNKVSSDPAPSVDVPVPVDAPVVEDVAPVAHPGPLRLADDTPDRPKRGKVKADCPTCIERVKHDRDGICQQCGQPNALLQAHWGLASEREQLEDLTDLVDAATPDVPVIEEIVLEPIAAPTQVAAPVPVAAPLPVAEPVIAPLPVAEPAPAVAPLPVAEPVIEPLPVAVPAVAAEPAPVALPTPAPVAAPVAAGGRCTSCNRRALPDLDGNCSFCGTSLGVPA